MELSVFVVTLSSGSFCGFKREITSRCAVIKTSLWSRSFETQGLYFNQTSWWIRGSGIKTLSEKGERGKKLPPGCCRGGFASLLTCSPLAPLVVALESFHHKQLAQILRGKLLHVLAVVVDLPCWRGNDSNTQTRTHSQRWGGAQGGGDHEISGDQVVAGGEEKRAA